MRNLVTFSLNLKKNYVQNDVFRLKADWIPNTSK